MGVAPLPDGWEEADGQPVYTPWSPIYGEKKPDCSKVGAGFACPPGVMRYRFIIKVASSSPSPLDIIVREIFNPSKVAT